MTDRGILFSAPMVRAILDGRKTQTRRIVKPQPENDGSGGVVREADAWIWHGGKALRRAGYGADYVHTERAAMERAMLAISPWKVGDRLWVRETWAVHWMFDDLPPREAKTSDLLVAKDGKPDNYWYLANGLNATSQLGNTPHGLRGKWRPGMFMPRWASRITLEVTEVSVERVQEISERDAIAEGAPLSFEDTHGDIGSNPFYRYGFYHLWKAINGQASWDANPWVRVIGFKVIKP